MLLAEGITHRFGDRWLFDSLDLRLEPSSITAIVGPSGVGKSTLLAILGGFLTPSEGEVRRDPPGPEAIAWVLQGANGLPARSTIDNAALYARLDGLDTAAAAGRATNALEAVGLTGRHAARARTLSGGENQRLCVARALASDRPFLFADEPTSQLDRVNARLTMNALHAHATSGRLVVVVTHDVDALAPGMRVLELDGERLGSPTRAPTP